MAGKYQKRAGKPAQIQSGPQEISTPAQGLYGGGTFPLKPNPQPNAPIVNADMSQNPNNAGQIESITDVQEKA